MVSQASVGLRSSGKDRNDLSVAEDVIPIDCIASCIRFMSASEGRDEYLS